MTIRDFGYTSEIERYFLNLQFPELEAGRVITENRERYQVVTKQGEVEAEVTGHLRFSAKTREDFPAVGDWVALTVYDHGFAIIHQVLPRSSIIRRQAAGQQGEIQVIAANVDTALIVQAVDRDFNINRLERYLTICYASKVSPVIVLTKVDLIDDDQQSAVISNISRRIQQVQVVAVSNETLDGYDQLADLLEKGKTFCMLGSSGVGKSTLLNNLSGSARMKTASLSQSTEKGRHTTSHREMIVLDNGAILIDNPGMREVGIADTSDGLETTYDLIYSLATSCRFKDCTHTTETGCAVLEAVQNGMIHLNSFENYLKLEREKAHFNATLAEKRQKEREFGKMMKNYHKDMRKNLD